MSVLTALSWNSLPSWLLPRPSLASQNYFLMDFLTPSHYHSTSPPCLRGPKLPLSIPNFSLATVVPDTKAGHPKVYIASLC